MPFDATLLEPASQGFDESLLEPIAPPRLDPVRLASGPPLPNQIAIDPELSRTTETLARSESNPDVIYGVRGLRQAKEEEQGYKDWLTDRWRNSWTPTGLKQSAVELLGSPMRAVSTVQKAIGLPTETPLQIPKFPEKEQRWAQIGAGALNTGIDFANFFLTPDGVASMGLGGVAKPIQKAALTMIGGEMALNAPEQYHAAIAAAKNGDWQQATERTLGFVAESGLGAHLISKGALPDKPQYKQPARDYRAAQMPTEAEADEPLKTDVEYAGGEMPATPGVAFQTPDVKPSPKGFDESLLEPVSSPTPEEAPELTHPILGLTEKQLSLNSLRTLKMRDPQQWDAVTKVFGTKTVPEVARLAKARFEQMRQVQRAADVESALVKTAFPPEQSMGEFVDSLQNGDIIQLPDDAYVAMRSGDRVELFSKKDGHHRFIKSDGTYGSDDAEGFEAQLSPEQFFDDAFKNATIKKSDRVISDAEMSNKISDWSNQTEIAAEKAATEKPKALIAEAPTTASPAKAFNKSVRDHPIRGNLNGDIISVKVGGLKLAFSASELKEMTNFQRHEMLNNRYQHWDDEPGGAGQSQRLRDAVRSVLNELVAPKQSFQERIEATKKERAAANTATKPSVAPRVASEQPYSILTALEGDVGKIRTKSAMRPGEEGYYGELYKQARKAAPELFSESGQSADSAVDTLRRSKVLREEHGVDDLWEAIIAAKKSGNQLRKTNAAEKASATAESKQEPIGRDTLGIGDTFTIKSEPYEVISIDADTGRMYVKGMGDLGPAGELWIDRGSMVKAPEGAFDVPAEPAKPTGGELFSSAETPFNLTGETQRAPEPRTEPGKPSAAQVEMFDVQKITNLSDPAKSAKAAVELYGSPEKAIARIQKQLEVIDSDPETRKHFAKEQRQRLKEVVALLRQQPAKPIFPSILARRMLSLPSEARSDGFGPRNVELRQDVLEALTGTRPPKAKAGATATRLALAKHFGIDVTQLAGHAVEEAILKHLEDAAQPKGIAASAREKLQQGNNESAFIRLPAAIDEDFAAKVRGAAGHTLPKITAKIREVGEAGARYLSSRIAAPYKALMFTTKVLSSGVDGFKFGAALVEDNLRSIRQSFQADGHTEAADRVHSLIGADHSPFRTEAEYQAFLADPVTQEAIRRHKQLWEEEIDPQYKMAQGIDADVELPSRGLQTGARINLKALLEGEGGTRVVTAGRGSLLSTFKRKSPFARTAKGSAQRYETAYQEIIANTYAKQLEIANQNHFNRLLVENGLAVVRPQAPADIGGEAPSRAYPLRHRLILSDGRAFAKNENLYLTKPLEEEYRAAVNVDAPGRIPGITPIINTLNKAALFSVSEATGHLWNLTYRLLNHPGGNLLADTLLKYAARADVIPTLFKVLEVSRRNNIEQLAQLAEIGALREPFHGLGPGNKVIGWFDKTVRLVTDDAYKEGVRRGIYENSETARREFTNQIGQYNKRAQGPLMRWLRDTGLGPFATAGRAFNALGIRSITLSPGVKAASVPAALALKANMLGSIVGFFVLRAILNYTMSGNVNGRSGTKLMDIDLGSDDDNGRPRRLPLGDLIGPGRGLRVTGISGAVEAKRAGLENSDAITSGFRQVSTAALSPGWGPLPRATSTVLLGRPTIYAPQIAPTARPDQSQPVINTLTAAKEANPIVATVADLIEGRGVNTQKLLGRVSPLPGMTSEKYEALPEIVKRAKTRDYKEWLVHEANKLAPEKREPWLEDRMEQVDFSLRDRREIRTRTRR